MFNLFKKKEKEEAPVALNPKTILCIPGNWQDRAELVTAIAENNLDEFIFAGMLLYNMNTKQGFTVEVYERDERLRNSFRAAGMVNRVSEAFLDDIDAHNMVVYVIAEGGSLDNAKAIASAGNAVLKAGGIGIKIETTGKAFTKEHWHQLLTDNETSNLYRMFVIDSIRDEDGTTYSCGMHNLGFKDTIVADEEFQDSVDLISIFSHYQLLESPTIKVGQTFSIDADAPVFEIIDEHNQPYLGDELFGNPYGMWRLQRKSK